MGGMAEVQPQGSRKKRKAPASFLRRIEGFASTQFCQALICTGKGDRRAIGSDRGDRERTPRCQKVGALTGMQEKRWRQVQPEESV